MTYRIETTDPISGKKLNHLMDMPYVVQDLDDDDLVIYFESEQNKEKYLENPTEHKLAHYHN